MGLTFSKSVRFGPARFNFSTRGIGMSVGVPGLRIGTGPRGAYIAGGIGGFRYRQSLGSGQARRGASKPGLFNIGNGSPKASSAPDNVSATIEHDTMDVLALDGASSDDLLRSMNEQRAKISWWPFVAGFMLFVLVLISNHAKDADVSTWQGPVMTALSLLSFPLVGFVAWRDRMRKLTVLFFEPDAKTQEAFEKLHGAARQAMSARRVKGVAQTSVYRDTKYSAGASRGLKFTDASISIGQAPGVRCNMDVPLLKANRTTLAFFPDRILVFKFRSVGAIAYDRLQFSSQPMRYIEHERVASDARVIDRTWQYVNRTGGPDRRFKSNRELPICEFNECALTTPDGFDVRFIASRPGAFDAMAKATYDMRAR